MEYDSDAYSKVNYTFCFLFSQVYTNNNVYCCFPPTSGHIPHTSSYSDSVYWDPHIVKNPSNATPTDRIKYDIQNCLLTSC